MRAEVFFEAGMQTGEGPIWDPRNSMLYCVDSTNPSIWVFSPEGRVVDRMALPDRIGFVVLSATPGVLVAGLKSGLFQIDLETRASHLLLDPEPDLPENRINDGVVDLDGALVFGSLDDSEREATGRVYRLAPNGSLTQFDDGYIVSTARIPIPMAKGSSSSIRRRAGSRCSCAGRKAGSISAGCFAIGNPRGVCPMASLAIPTAASG